MSDGRHDFDFIAGRWRVHNRRLVDPLDSRCTEWEEFETLATAELVLAGGGNVDRFFGDGWEALTLRLYDPQTAEWSIYWSSTRAPGRLDPPLAGRFVEGVGIFQGADVVNERPIKLRFTWTTAGDGPTWQQEISWDDGGYWTRNWTMQFRADE